MSTTLYDGAPIWEIDRPQDDIVRLHRRGGFRGDVLDIGCGSGANAVFLASKQLNVLGIDRNPAAIDQAKARATAMKSSAQFEVADPIELKKLRRKFDTILDCGLFHTLSDSERSVYVMNLASAIKPKGIYHLLCFSDQEPGRDGPRRIGERELIDLLNMKGWLVEEIAEARFETTIHPDGARAWLATFQRHGS
ncbi:MAG: class I SAM-dependent methyltransferase [Planctomycetia bacterium]|nr:class I SAM-dependent methyltransferase [Planctomycetia bacterium]